MADGALEPVFGGSVGRPADRPAPPREWFKLGFLLLLYTIQGVPMGLGASLPLLLQGRMSYREAGHLALISLPFSLKVLWAPVIDSVYSRRVGRRRSWLVPAQLLCACLMLFCDVDAWVDPQPRVLRLAAFFTLLYFLMATQDVAVDGWALSMLSVRNRPLASSCNSIGQSVGFFTANAGFLALHDGETCRRWLGRFSRAAAAAGAAAGGEGAAAGGLVTLGSFLRFWGWVFLLATCLAAFVSEQAAEPEWESAFATAPGPGQRKLAAASGGAAPPPAALRKFSGRSGGQPRAAVAAAAAPGCDDAPMSLRESYASVLALLRMRPVRRLTLLLLVCRLPFAPIEALVTLKLLETGLRKQQLAMFGPLLLPISVFASAIVGRYASKDQRPLRWFRRGWWMRLALTFAWIAVIFAVAAAGPAPGFAAVAIVFLVSALQTAAGDLMFSAQMAFFARVADPALGGSYMTLLNTISNLGSRWPTIFVLYVGDWLVGSPATAGAGAMAGMSLGSFARLVLAFDLLGVVWMSAGGGRRSLKFLESLPREAWQAASLHNRDEAVYGAEKKF